MPSRNPLVNLFTQGKAIFSERDARSSQRRNAHEIETGAQGVQNTRCHGRARACMSTKKSKGKSTS
jgi:hypothetical protein